MRRRILILSFVTMTSTFLILSAVFFQFFSGERFRLIDQHLESVASSVLASGLQDLRDEEQISSVLSSVLKQDPTVILISLYDPFIGLIYRNQYMRAMGSPIFPRSPSKLTVEFKDHSLRVLNLKLRSGHYLQLALLLDQGEWRWDKWKGRLWIYFLLIVGLLLLATYFMTRITFKPLNDLSLYIQEVSSKMGDPKLDKYLSPSLSHYLKNPEKGDAFYELLKVVKETSHSLSQRFQMNQRSATQMAHELKTPLTVIRNTLETFERSGEVPENLKYRSQSAIQEVDRLSQTISSFLEWSRLYSSGKDYEEELHALSVKSLVGELIESFELLYPSRFQLNITEDFKIFASPEWARQVFRNLLENAAKYSDKDSSIFVNLHGQEFEIKNKGSPIPSHVLERLGEPFNVAAYEGEEKGSGLGLAWTKMLCDRYKWALEFEYQKPYQIVKIKFNS